jgi:hypothetical protein
MKNLFLKGTKDTPTIDFDKDKNVLEISGSSYPEDTFKFYAPINDWMEEFLKITGRQIQVNFKMLHFNSSSALFYLEFLKLLESYQLQSKGVIKINWHYKREDLDMLEIGEDYSMDTELSMKYIPF